MTTDSQGFYLFVQSLSVAQVIFSILLTIALLVLAVISIRAVLHLGTLFKMKVESRKALSNAMDPISTMKQEMKQEAIKDALEGMQESSKTVADSAQDQPESSSSDSGENK